jgi:hypothetical protein
MAKISTYPNVGTPVLSDILIGTDVTNNNATVNFQISDILGLIGSLGLYVPYTGATANVNLGAFNLDAQDLTLTGDGFFGNNITVTGLTTSDSITYSGNLYAAPGSASIFGDVVVLEQELRDGFNLPGTAGQLLSSTGALTQWVTYGLQEVLTAGNTAAANITLTGASLITTNSITYGGSLYAIPGSASIFGDVVILEKELRDGFNLPGTPGQVLSSTGVLTQWVSLGSLAGNLQSVLTAGNTATEDINLTGTLSVTGNADFFGPVYLDDALLDGGGSAGTAGQVLITNVTNTAWTTYGLQEVLTAGDTATGDITLTGDIYLSGKFYDGINSPGLAGEYLQSTSTSTQWVSPAFGQFYEISSQNVAANTPTAMQFGTVDLSFGGVSVVSSTQITVTQDAYYNIQVSAQLRCGSGATEFDVWFVINGSDIAYSAKSYTLSSNTYSLAVRNYIKRLTPGDTLEIYWMHDNSGGLQSLPLTLLHPAVPSASLTVTKVS